MIDVPGPDHVIIALTGAVSRPKLGGSAVTLICAAKRNSGFKKSEDWCSKEIRGDGLPTVLNSPGLSAICAFCVPVEFAEFAGLADSRLND